MKCEHRQQRILGMPTIIIPPVIGMVTQMQMFEETTPIVTETPCFLVLISAAAGVYSAYVDGNDREAARATGHVIALERLGLDLEAITSASLRRHGVRSTDRCCLE